MESFSNSYWAPVSHTNPRDTAPINLRASVAELAKWEEESDESEQDYNDAKLAAIADLAVQGATHE